jgi:hypothetical protein
MSNDETNGSKPSELTRLADELAETQRALARLAESVCNSHFAQRQDLDRIERAIERATDKVVANGERLANVLERLDSTREETSDEIEHLRSDLSPMHAPAPADPQVEIGPVKLPESTWRKALPIVGYVLLGAALAVVAAAAAGAWLVAHGR